MSKDLDVICCIRIKEILEWSSTNSWFDTGFVLSISHQLVFSAGQRKAINNIWEKFCNGKKF